MLHFNRQELEFYLPNSFKKLSKSYMLDCIFNSTIQANWIPDVGDIIVGKTGNIFVISGKENLDDSIGCTMYYFGGSSCNREGGCVLDSTHCYTANESGIYFHPINGIQTNLYHSSIRAFKFVPYPHELKVCNQFTINKDVE